MKTSHVPWKAALVVVSIGLMLGAFSCGLSVAPELWMRYEAWQTRQLLPPLGEVTVYLQHEYYGPMPSRDELTRGAIEGMLETLGDPYARLIEPQNNVSAVDIFTGKYGDVGADVVWDEGWRLVPYPTGPAALAGVQSGDRLLSLDGRTVQALSRADIETALSGAEGTPVTLELERNGERFTLTVVRAEVPHPSVSAYLLTPEVGYIRVARITETTAEECRAALQVDGSARGGARPARQSRRCGERGAGHGRALPPARERSLLRGAALWRTARCGFG